MFYIIYKITNKLNSKIYIGCHKTKNIKDNYMGSGKYISAAIKKYGIEQFEKEILFVFDNPDDMYSKEAEIVTEEFISKENTYNLKKGGSGGFSYVNDNNLNNKANQCSKGGKAAAAKGVGFKDKKHSEKTKKYLSMVLTGRSGSFKNKNHSEKTKALMSQVRTGTGKGESNSQFGTMWITNGIENKKVKKESLIESGWKKGRVCNKK